MALNILNELIYNFDASYSEIEDTSNNGETHQDHLLLNKNEKLLVVAGYIREYNLSKSIPDVIKQTIVHYFDEVFYIKLSGNNLCQFFNIDQDDLFYEIYSLKYNEYITFECHLFIVIDIEDQSERVCLLVAPQFDKSKVSDIGYIIDLRCPQTETYWKLRYDTNFTEDDEDWLEGIHNGELTVKECKKINKLKELIFNVYVDIDYINYQNNTNWFKPLKIMNKYTSFKWNIDDDLIDNFKKYEVGKNFYSDLSDDSCWFLQILPCGETQDNVHNGYYDVLLYLHCWKIPYRINQIDIDNVIEIKRIDGNKENIIYFDDTSFYVNREKNCFWIDIGKSCDLFQTALEINVHIDIQYVTTNEWESMNADKLVEYNIL